MPRKEGPSVGDRFEDRDRRHEGRIVEVTKVNILAGRAQIRVDVHPNNPDAVGIHRWVSWSTLAERYWKVSH